MKTKTYHETLKEEIQVGEDLIEVEFFGDFTPAAPMPGYYLDGIHCESWRFNPEENKAIETFLNINFSSIYNKLLG